MEKVQILGLGHKVNDSELWETGRTAVRISQGYSAIFFIKKVPFFSNLDHAVCEASKLK